jgi:hypothetical protein
MKIINKTKRLICIQTKEGRVDVLPGVITDNKSLDKLKGKNKIFDFYLENGDFKEVGSKDKGPSEKELLTAEAVELGIENATTLSVKKLKIAIHEAKQND